MVAASAAVGNRHRPVNNAASHDAAFLVRQLICDRHRFATDGGKLVGPRRGVIVIGQQIRGGQALVVRLALLWGHCWHSATIIRILGS